jgi:hypothetical protein
LIVPLLTAPCCEVDAGVLCGTFVAVVPGVPCDAFVGIVGGGGTFWPLLFGWKKLLILAIEFEIDVSAAAVNVLRDRWPDGVLKTAAVPASKAAPPTYTSAALPSTIQKSSPQCPSGSRVVVGLLLT